jgi:hypothetical protein
VLLCCRLLASGRLKRCVATRGKLYCLQLRMHNDVANKSVVSCTPCVMLNVRGERDLGVDRHARSGAACGILVARHVEVEHAM